MKRNNIRIVVEMNPKEMKISSSFSRESPKLFSFDSSKTFIKPQTIRNTAFYFIDLQMNYFTLETIIKIQLDILQLKK